MINQFVIGLILVGLFWLKSGEWSAISALFGMFSALSIAAVLGYGVIRANKVATSNPQRSMGIIYFGAVQRFILVLGLFMFGLGVLKLDPLAMAVTFGLTQLAYTINLRHQAKV
jgi:ATP synthase protein I